MERQAVYSSNIAELGYDAEQQVLEVAYNSGGVYAYQGVTPEEYQALMSAPSLGGWIAANIKKTKPTERIE